MKLLTGDIGGTNTRLAVYDLAEGRLVDGAAGVYPSGDYPSLPAILAAFCGQCGSVIDAGCFAVAGPVRNGRSEITNLPGIDALDDSDCITLNAGEPDAGGNRAVIAAGTGLGQAGLCRSAGHYHPFASEGGHADFAPADAEQARLLSWLADKYGHVSWERVVSGPGLVDLYGYCRERRQAPMPDWLVQAEDPAATISAAALDGRDEACRDALDIFVRCYGAEAGNLALKQMATAGVYLAGGIAPKLLERLQQGDFMQAFTAKGRMGKLLKSIPVRIVINGQVSLLGAAAYARDRFARQPLA
jgi:glucokinase